MWGSLVPNGTGAVGFIDVVDDLVQGLRRDMGAEAIWVHWAILVWRCLQLPITITPFRLERGSDRL